MGTPNWSELNPETPNWSELNPDLLRCVFERLSFTSFNRAKLVCSSWYSASRGVPNQNQFPWLILLPSGENNRCVFFVPEDKEKVYRSRDLGVDFDEIYCMTTCGSWLLLVNTVQNLYILNVFTGESIDLPDTESYEPISKYEKVCFWIDNKTKDYLVVTIGNRKFTKKGYNNWHNLDCDWCEDVFYNDKNQELYLHVIDHNNNNRRIDIWDFSGDKPHKDRIVPLPPFRINLNDFCFSLDNEDPLTHSRMAFTVSGDFLMVSVAKHRGAWYFCIYKRNQMDNKWVQIHSLGDEALIYDMGITVIANDSISGIKKNSIYFSIAGSFFMLTLNLNSIFVYDLTTHQKEPLPQCVLSSMPSYTKARWFFPY